MTAVMCEAEVGAPCRTATDVDYDPHGGVTVDIDGCRAIAAWSSSSPDRYLVGFLDGAEGAVPVPLQNGPIVVEERLPGEWWWRYATESAQAVTGPQEAAA